MGALTLRLHTPEGYGKELECDHVNLFARDNALGEGGGSVGIRRSHCAAVIALADNAKIEAKLDGRPVFKGAASGGFAMVKDDIVTVLTDHIEEVN
ncbi:MAG: hypothetical protein IKP26_06205 [Clostridia bacterium]|jgi:F0F1-type ATP synthase epsilon subunit|nr:hypothetical protein [Clostridia bacterium]